MLAQRRSHTGVNRRRHCVFCAEMTERSIVTDCKSVARLGYIGSNPILGTKYITRTNLFILGTKYITRTNLFILEKLRSNFGTRTSEAPFSAQNT